LRQVVDDILFGLDQAVLLRDQAQQCCEFKVRETLHFSNYALHIHVEDIWCDPGDVIRTAYSDFLDSKKTASLHGNIDIVLINMVTCPDYCLTLKFNGEDE
jgi:hypothetical protein